MAAPKFKPGATVNHPKDPDGTFKKGTGTVDSVEPGKGGAPHTYRVKSADTGEVLDADFVESELTAGD